MKLIVVPIDKEAEERLGLNQNIESDLINVFLNQEDYDQLWATSFFERINVDLNILIDDFEDESISGKENLKKLHSIIVEYEKNTPSNPIVSTLKSLTEAAIRFETSVIFSF